MSILHEELFFAKSCLISRAVYSYTMRLHRFFVSDTIGSKKEITVRDSALAHQLKNVFRFTVGGQVILFDNTGYEYHALIGKLGNSDIVFSIASKRMSKTVPDRELFLFFSIVKKDNSEFILQKGTEVGVSHFVPILSDRSEKKGFNLERAQKIVREAAEQSGRAVIPTVGEIVSFDEAISQEFPRFAFDSKGDVFTPEHAQKHSPLGVFIGPEGGWAEREIFLFKKQGVKVYSLGSATLRAETAAIVASSLILLG